MQVSEGSEAIRSIIATFDTHKKRKIKKGIS